MKKFLVFFICVAFLIGCKEKPKVLPQKYEKQASAVGHWDNFQQYWLENTETDIHRTETDDKHRHLSLTIAASGNGEFSAELREGRNGENLVETMTLTANEMTEGNFKLNADTLFVSGGKQFQNKDPYRFIRTRNFSGWLEYPMKQFKDSTFRKSNLEIHDQGGMAEIDIDGEFYTAELTQLLFGHKLPIMKLAIYDMPIDSVEINSRSISYTWLNPDAKRTGINLRKVVTGWTLIEPGYVNSDNTKFKEKK